MIKIFADIEKLNVFAAEKFIEIGNEATERRGRFSVALSGGSTPKALFKLLAGDEFGNQINWTKVFFFFGDERDVTPDDDESNFRMANETLFEPLQISPENVFRWQTELKDAEKIAENYSTTLVKFFIIENEKSIPKFDLILLGMGADGHTASLFPNTNALFEEVKFAVANFVEKLDTTRLTLTFPVINNAANIIFLVAGAEKAEALREVLQGDFQPEKFPSQKVNPRDGNLIWLVDEQAARLV